MAFDKPTRKSLASFVGKARDLIVDEFTQQFQSLYGISDEGVITPLDQLSHLDDMELATAALLREQIDYFVKTHPDDPKDNQAAVARLAREQAFTILNRLAAIRMAEKRDIIVEAVGKGYQSKGFKVFEQIAGSGLGDTYHRYRRYIFCLFDELAEDLGVLFDRRSPQGLLFPRESVLQDIFALLNEPDLESLWAEDETIGWIYQYYNDPAERKKMRDESAAPRNSRELAVRNQFFTPRYVVEFLTDNTLGRIWYEVTQGNTRLTEQCRYLVRRPTEVFLKAGESAPEVPSQEGLTQKELLKQPVHIPHRLMKDPRELLMLDPACGSMHFGLYAFDLFETIYEEAWDLGIESLCRDYPDKDTFLRKVPRLIIEHNIHGIDIDPRAVQIAGLSLWLRAQKSWQAQHIPAAARPRIMRSNIVCAEPMPGSPEMLKEFIATLHPPLLGQLVEKVFVQMQLAGEAGSLLKIEEEIETLVKDAKKLWKTRPRTEQMELDLGLEVKQKQRELPLDVSGISDERFWDTAEEHIYSALHSYAEQAQTGVYQRRLFAEDAAHGFAFIDLCRKKYDVVVMNPPFGYPSERSKAYVDEKYPDAKYDILAAFIDRGYERLLARGYTGCITSRTVFFIEVFKDWRRELFDNKGLQIFVDLGSGVLEALVETAAFVIKKLRITYASTFVRLLSSLEKDVALATALTNLANGIQIESVFSERVRDFLCIEGFPMAYWVAKSFRKHFNCHLTVKTAVGEVRVGLQTGDDFRFIRTAWEVDAQNKGRGHRWVPLAKGGEYRKYYDDIHLLVNWAGDGAEIIFFVDNKGKQRSRPQNVACYYKPGLTYPMRTRSNFSPRVLPSGCIFNVQGNSIFETNNNRERLFAILAVLSSSTFESFTRLKARIGDMTTAGGAGFAYTPGLVGSMPFPELEPKTLELLTELAKRSVTAERTKDRTSEPSAIFVRPVLTATSDSLRNALQISLKKNEEADIIVLESLLSIEKKVQEAYGFSDSDVLEVRSQFGEPVAALTNTIPKDSSVVERLYKTGVSVGEEYESRASQQLQLSSDRHLRIDEICRVAQISPRQVVALRQQNKWVRDDELFEAVSGLIGYGVGSIFGCWDIRFATGERRPPELPDPFAPLPKCPPGMLQNTDGLPAEPKDVPAGYPLRISWPGILVDDENHPQDIVGRAREVVEVIWKDRAERIEHEACELLGTKTLRDYFRRPAGFFADHLKRYSKSRRQAPIYWPLSTADGSYTLWIYYHRLTDQTLHTALADFIDPKLKAVRAEISALRESGNHRARLEELLNLEKELADFRTEIENIIKLPWKPDLNDGVLITASPLWKLFRLPKWQKDLKACWDKLEKGEYDWAHLAYSIWPKRIEEGCKKDRSIAIAHNLEHLCEVTTPKTKIRKKKTVASEEDES